MNLEILRFTTAATALAWLISFAGAAGSEPGTMSAKDLAAGLSALRDGASYVRLRLEVK